MQLLLRVSKIDYFPSDKYWNCLRLSAHHANSLIVLLSSRSRSHGLNLCKWAFVPHLLNYWTCLPQTWYAGVSLPDWPVKSLGILSTVSRWQGSNPQKMGLHHISSDLLKLLRPNLVPCYANSWWSVMCGDWMRGCRAETHKSQEAYITQALLYYSNWVTTKEYRTQAVMIVWQSRRHSRIEVLDNVRHQRGHAAFAVPDLCVCV